MLNPTKRQAKSFIALFLLGCSFGCLPTPGNAQNDEQASVRHVVEQFFAAFQQRDLSAVMALWSEKSPDLAACRQSMQQAFAAYRKIELKSLRVNRIAVETNNATVQLIAELSVVGTQSDASVTSLQMSRTIQMAREMGTWKIWKYLTPEDELAAALSAVATPEERNALLNAQPELVTPDLVKALAKQGKELLGRGKQPQALMICDLALSIAQRLMDKPGMFMALRLKGDINRGRGDYKQALEYYDRCLNLAEELGDKVSIGDALTSIGIIRGLQSDYVGALAHFQRSLQIREEIGDKLNIARELSNIGNIYVSQGDRVRALENFQRSLKLADEAGNRAGASATLNSIGSLYYAQGNYPQALEYFHQSLKTKQEIGDKLGVGRALNNIGIIYSLQGQYAQALDYLQQTAKIKEELGDHAGTVEVLHNIGGVYLTQGDYTQALAYEQKVLKPAEELGNHELIGDILQNISDCYLRLGQYQTANEYANRASALASQFGIPEVLWNSRTIAGKAHLALNQPQLARQDFLDSIATIEKLRGQVAGGEQEQQRFFENKVVPYQAMVELLLAQNDPAQALSYAERAKGRVLLDVLSSGRADINKAMTTAELTQDRTMTAEIASLNSQLARLKAQSKPNETQLAELKTQLDKTRLEYEAFQSSLYAAHPELKVQRGQTPLLTPDEAATLLPDNQSAILEYVVTEDKAYLFVLRKSASTGVGNKAPADLTVHTLNINRTDLAKLAESFRQQVGERDLTVKQPARQLYELLVKPAETELRAVRKLCIVPDGVLWDVPFQALHQGERGYLLEQYALSYAPSLSVLREMGRRATALRTAHRRPTVAPVPAAGARTNAQPELLALGNPNLSGETVAKVRFTRRDEPLNPLPDAEKEVKALGRLYGPGSSSVLIGAQAREATVKAEARKYVILHFATHAVLDDRNPLYSRIILSRSEGDAQEDGLLEAWEIMKLDLNAELAVLSACQTARGRVAAGEGVIGMSWALFVAGSPAAVVSQWKVDSARSSELMIEFHRNLLQKRGAGKTALSKSEALRQAALKLLHGPYNHPAYWAGFILIGDDN
jgi:CHAT domain-containing protein/tetratricopeptide (TPR) repeat protein